MEIYEKIRYYREHIQVSPMSKLWGYFMAG